jgi:clusterin-associated protein 1
MYYFLLKETTEILRTLGFPRLVSMENFRYPNFALMAEVLEWIVRK